MMLIAEQEVVSLEVKNKVRPYYNELQGYLSKAPDDKGAFYREDPEWQQVNIAIDLLNTATEKNYDRFKLSLLQGYGGNGFVRLTAYKQKLAGLISYLHGEYFYDEPPPFSGMPSTIITHNLSQQQSQQQSMTITLLELQSKIDQKLSSTKGEKEKSFLQKLKDALPTVTSIFQLIQLVLTLVHQTGIDPHIASTLLA